jgi:hypothetical protein
METLIKSTTDAMKEMMLLIKSNGTNPMTSTKATDDDKKKKRDEKQRKYNEAPIYTHCGKKHPSKKEEDCWELEKNKASRPDNWKSTKSTCRCAGSLVETETWQPGKVVSNKLNTINTYPAVTNYWTPLNDIDDDEPTTTKEELNVIKSQTPTPTLNKWKRRIVRRQERRRQKEDERNHRLRCNITFCIRKPRLTENRVFKHNGVSPG